MKIVKLGINQQSQMGQIYVENVPQARRLLVNLKPLGQRQFRHLEVRCSCSSFSQAQLEIWREHHRQGDFGFRSCS
jgi:hypothetical protein